jgi:hypothetical protein
MVPIVGHELSRFVVALGDGDFGAQQEFSSTAVYRFDRSDSCQRA